MIAMYSSGFYPPKSGIEIGCNFPPSFELKFPQFLTQVFHSILGFFPLYGESFVKGVDCPVKNKGEVKIGFFVKGVDCPVKIGGEYFFVNRGAD